MNVKGLIASGALLWWYFKNRDTDENGNMDIPETNPVDDKITHANYYPEGLTICPGLAVEYVGNRVPSYRSDFDALGYVTFAYQSLQPIYIFRVDVCYDVVDKSLGYKTEDVPRSGVANICIRGSKTGRLINYETIQIGGEGHLVGLSSDEIKTIKENLNRSAVLIENLVSRATVTIWWGYNKDDWGENRAMRWDGLEIPCKLVTPDNLRGISGQEALEFEKQFRNNE